MEPPPRRRPKTAPVALLPQVEQFLVLEASDVPRFGLVLGRRLSSLFEVIGSPCRPDLVELKYEERQKQIINKMMKSYLNIGWQTWRGYMVAANTALGLKGNEQKQKHIKLLFAQLEKIDGVPEEAAGRGRGHAGKRAAAGPGGSARLGQT